MLSSCVRAKSRRSCPTLCDSVDCGRQAPLSVGFSRQEYWSGVPWPPAGELLDPEVKPGSPALAGGFFTTDATWEALPHCRMAICNSSHSESGFGQSDSLNLEVYLCRLFSQFSSVQFSRSVVSDSLQPHGLQHARPPCPSATPRVHSNSCPSSR